MPQGEKGYDLLVLICSTSGGPGGKGNQHARASAALREAPSRAKRGAAVKRRLGGNSPVYCRGMEERLGAGNHEGFLGPRSRSTARRGPGASAAAGEARCTWWATISAETAGERKTLENAGNALSAEKEQSRTAELLSGGHDGRLKEPSRG